MLKMTDLQLAGKRVLIRLDLNVPVQNGQITSDARIRAALPTIQLAVKQGARVMLMSHLGRPKEGAFDAAFSLKPVAVRLSELLGQTVLLGSHCPEPGQAVLFENVRFNVGEKANDPALSQKLAALCDVFVMDAFGSSHRAHASTCGVAQVAPQSCAGPLLVQELEQLGKLFQNPKRPLVAVVGGAKVSTKLSILEALIQKVDVLIVGGGIANTFLAATGAVVGKSLYEPEQLVEAKHLLQLAEAKGVQLPLPEDVVVAETLSNNAVSHIKNVSKITASECIFDIGPETAACFEKIIQEAGTILWNGPVGAFEYAPFETGTKRIALAIATSNAFTVAGGGDTVAAIERYGLQDKIDYLSTGGGAFLEFLEGKTLPGVGALEEPGLSH